MPITTAYNLSNILTNCADRKATELEHLLLNAVLNKTFLEQQGLLTYKLALNKHIASVKASEELTYALPDISHGVTVKLDCDLYVIPKAGVSRRKYLQQFTANDDPDYSIEDIRFAVVLPQAQPENIIYNDAVVGTKVALSHIITPSQDIDTGLLHVDEVAKLKDHPPVYLENYPTIQTQPELRDTLSQRARGRLNNATWFYKEPNKSQETECEALLVDSNELVIFTDENTAAIRAQYVPKFPEEYTQAIKLQHIEDALQKIDSRFFHGNGKADTETNTFQLAKQLLKNKTLPSSTKLMLYSKIFERSATQSAISRILVGREKQMQDIAIAVRDLINFDDAQKEIVFPRYNIEGNLHPAPTNAQVIALHQITADIVSEQINRAKAHANKNLNTIQKRREEFLARNDIKKTLESLYESIDNFIKANQAQVNVDAAKNAVTSNTAKTIFCEISAIMHMCQQPTLEEKIQAIRQVLKICQNHTRFEGSVSAFFTRAKVDVTSQNVINLIAMVGDRFADMVLATNMPVNEAANTAAISMNQLISAINSARPAAPLPVVAP